MQRFGVTVSLAALIMLAASISNEAAAQTYRWCAIYGQLGGSQNCGFNTREQCQSAVSGAGGVCQENPQWRGSDAAERPARKKRKGD